MKVLAIETATESCSATLEVDGKRFHDSKVAPRQHTELILPMINSLITEAEINKTELDMLAFGRGPGAFTGVRIATGIIQGLAYSLQKPVVAISSLRALAQAHIQEHELVAAAFDARMGEVYWACFNNNNGIAELMGDEQVLSPELVELPRPGDYLGVGSGFDTYREELQNKFANSIKHIESEAYPNANEVLDIALSEYEKGHHCEAKDISPVYLRDKVV